MILTSPRPDDLTAFSADVTVIGSGPVGLATALRMAGRGLRVMVLESGGEAADARAQSLSEAENLRPDNHYPPVTTVARRLGGTSNLWGGRALPYDPVDFAQRPWLSPELAAGWPVAHAELMPYVADASAFVAAGQPVYEAPLPGATADPAFSFTALERWSNVQRSQVLHRKELETLPNLAVVLGATVTGFAYADGRIAALDLHLEGQGATRLPARQVVLAAGGNESTRLLLCEQARQPGLFGGPDGPLGRYYMAHVNGQIADIVYENETLHQGMNFHVDANGSYVRRRFVPSEAVQRAERLPNVAFWPVVPPIADVQHRSGPLSAVFLGLSAKPVARHLLAEPIRIKHVGPPPYPRMRHIGNILRDPLRTLGFVPWFLWHNRMARMRLPGFFLVNPARRYGLEFHAEQLPDAESRLWLGEETDRLGMRRLKIDLRFSDADAQGVLRAHDALEQWLIRNRLGRIDYRMAREDRAAGVLKEAYHGTHQIGTIRMGTDPARAVVDADLKAFGLANLHVASSAVLPSSGQANPTLTTIMLGLRLADHLAEAGAGQPR